MKASELVAKMGKRLVGKYVVVPAWEIFPGGRVLVKEINPDPNAPEIVMTFKHPTWTHEDHPDGEIGVFDFEIVDT